MVKAISTFSLDHCAKLIFGKERINSVLTYCVQLSSGGPIKDFIDYLISV